MTDESDSDSDSDSDSGVESVGRRACGSVDGPPRDASAYRPTIHFSDRFHNRCDGPNRHLDGEIVRACLEDGHVERVPGERELWFFQATVCAVTYRLLANQRTGDVLTGYPIGMNERAALASGRWSRAAIEDIRAAISYGDALARRHG